MNKKSLLSIAIFAIISGNAFSQGKWNGENETVFKYSLESTSGKKKDKFSGAATPVQSISKADGEAEFLPLPEAGSAKVFIDANTGASFSLSGKGEAAKLKAIGSSSKATEAAAANVSKFSLYNIPSTAVTSLFFTLDVSAFATEGQIMVPFGHSPEGAGDNSTTFNNTKQFSEWWDTENIFGAFKLDIYDGTWMAYSYRQARTGTQDSEAPKFVELKAPTPFTKGRSHKIELYCNNSTASQSYIRDGKTFTVSPQTYHWWVNSERVQLDKNNFDFPATKETAIGNSINSFSINTSGNTKPTPNSLEVSISGITAQFIK